MKIQHPSPLYFSLFLLFLATTASLISPSLGALGKCNPSDYKALMSIKKSLNNPYHLASWQPNTDCCKWYVVKCDAKTNRINQLSMFSRPYAVDTEVSGQIPSSIGDLPYLETLTFRRFPNITGTIPQSITKLKNLYSLDLTYLSLSGPVPNFLNQLTKLNYLDLSFNQFSGSIPPNLSELKYLEAIHLDRNRLTGTIPESFGRFPGPVIPHLFLSHNQLSGPIPKSLGALDYGTIDLSRNSFVGDASILFNPNHGLTTYIDLSRNQFAFDFSGVKLPKSLAWLDLSHNKIFGGIPEEMKGLELYRLNVSYNRLCGRIPYGGRMQSFHDTDYFHNKCLCGSPMAACKNA